MRVYGSTITFGDRPETPIANECRRTCVQTCHYCDDEHCCDNTNPLALKLRAALARAEQAERERDQWHERADLLNVSLQGMIDDRNNLATRLRRTHRRALLLVDGLRAKLSATQDLWAKASLTAQAQIDRAEDAEDALYRLRAERDKLREVLGELYVECMCGARSGGSETRGERMARAVLAETEPRHE